MFVCVCVCVLALALLNMWIFQQNNGIVQEFGECAMATSCLIRNKWATKKPWSFRGLVGDYTTQFYGDYNKPCFLNNQYHGMSQGFFCGSNEFGEGGRKTMGFYGVNVLVKNMWLEKPQEFKELTTQGICTNLNAKEKANCKTWKWSEIIISMARTCWFFRVLGVNIGEDEPDNIFLWELL